MNTMEYQIFEPRGSSRETNDDILIIPNEIAASLADYHGAKAQYFADELGHRVLAYERPFSASRSRFDFGLRGVMPRIVEGVYEDTAQQLDEIVEKEGFSSLDINGHSGGATEAIGVMAANVLPIRAGMFTDPPGIRKSFPIYSEFIEYGLYTIRDELQKNKGNLVDTSNNPEPKNELLIPERLRRGLGELSVHSVVWRSTIAIDGLFKIAQFQKQARARVIFPEHTFVAKPSVLVPATKAINSIAHAEGADTRAIILQGTRHSHFDSYKTSLDLYRDVISDLVA